MLSVLMPLFLCTLRFGRHSGHVDGFNDPMVDCKNVKARFREDKIDLNSPCPNCGESDSFTEPKDFNLMFKTQMGPVEDSSSMIYMGDQKQHRGFS